MQIVVEVNDAAELAELKEQVGLHGGTVISNDDKFPKFFQGIAGEKVIEINPSATSHDWICTGVLMEEMVK